LTQAGYSSLVEEAGHERARIFLNFEELMRSSDVGLVPRRLQ